MARRRRVPPKKPSPQALAQAHAQQAARGLGGAARAKRMLLATTLVTLVGLAIGAGLAFVLPFDGLFSDERARAALRADTAASLASAADLADDDASLHPVGALARTLLFVDHAGGLVERKRAQARLKTTSASSSGPARTAPEALYARALLKRTATSPFVSPFVNGAADDGALDDDIAKRGEKSKSPFLLLAKATRALDEGKRDDAWTHFQRAALGADAPLRAQTELARLALARGELADARAIAERARRMSPKHAPARIAGVLASVLDDLREDSVEERAIKLKKLRARSGKKAGGPARPGEVDRDAIATDDARLLATWRSAEEEEAQAALETMDARDAAIVALFLQALAAARGDDEHAGELKARVVAVAKSAPALAARQMDLSLLEGDTSTVEELLTAHEAALEKGEEPELALQQARLAAMRLIPEEELRRRAGGPRSLTMTGARFPFGELAFDVWGPAVPLEARFDPAIVPEAAFFAALRSGAAGAALDKKLAVAVLVHKGDTALLRGDLVAAAEATAQAKEKAGAGADAEVLFLDARIRLRQADRDAARDAIDAAIATAPDDPHVLLVGARLHYDNEGFIPARKALKKLLALGFKSPAALALDAMLDARAGNEKSAQAALAEARAIGAEDANILRANLLILREGKDIAAAREAADRLRAGDQLKSADPILRAWQADSIARAGQKDAALAILDEVLAQRPNVGDAHYFRAELMDDAEGYTKAMQLAPGTVIALEAFKKKVAAAPTKPAPKLLPRKRR